MAISNMKVLLKSNIEDDVICETVSEKTAENLCGRS